jgi:hypothetical protein
MTMSMPSPANTPNTPAGPSAIGSSGTEGLSRRAIAITAGIWLAISAFVLPQTTSSLASVFVSGCAIAVTATFPQSIPRARFITFGLGLWLVASAFVLPHAADLTRWHDAAVGILVTFVAISARRDDDLADRGMHPFHA